MSIPATIPPAVPQSVKDLLFAGNDVPPELTRVAGEVAKSGGLSEALAKLTPVGLDILGSRIGALVGDMLNVDLGGMLGGALTRNAELAAAMRATAEQPGSEAVVTLADQTLQSSYSPAVDIVIDEVPLVSITFDVALATLIEGAMVIVRDGRMVAVQAARAHLAASLSCDGAPIAAREVELNLPAVLRLPQAVAGAAGTAVGAVGVVAGGAGAPGAGAGVPGPSATRTPGAPASASPPVGLIANGWRFTAAGTWEPATQSLPGDIVNGHRLNAAGTAWEPLPPA